jgi:hypothetical protein
MKDTIAIEVSVDDLGRSVLSRINPQGDPEQLRRPVSVGRYGANIVAGDRVYVCDKQVWATVQEIGTRIHTGHPGSGQASYVLVIVVPD